MSEQSTVPSLGQEVSALLDANLPRINRLLHKRGHRELSERVNVTGLARLLGVDRGRLADLLADRAQWNVHDIRAIANVLELPSDSISTLESLLDTSPVTLETQTSDPDDVLYPLNLWTRDMPLRRELHQVSAGIGIATEAGPELRAHLDRFSDVRGRVTAVTNVSGIDWHEGPGQDRFDLEVSETEYQLALATKSLIETDPERRAALRKAVVEAQVRDILDVAPQSLLAGNINLVTSDHRVLVAQRSGMVMTFKNEWNLGVNEGMKVTADGARTENFFELAARALDEELAIPENRLDDIVVNWFGYCLACCNFYIYAHARTMWTANEVEANRIFARDARELRQVLFPKLTLELLAAISNEASIEGIHQPNWLHHARLSARMLRAAQFAR